MTATHTQARPRPLQEQCIDLSGEAVRCWRSSDNLRVILRKHRDVFFEINLKPGTSYTVEATSDFYFPLAKKLVRKIDFKDGERLHFWVGREFKGNLTLKNGSSILGSFIISSLDTEKYGPDPQVKPEPLMVILGQRDASFSIFRKPDDPSGIQRLTNFFDREYDPSVAILKDYGAKQEYRCERDKPDVKEYVCVTEAVSSDIQPDVLRRLERGLAVEGKVSEIFNIPEKGKPPSGLYGALAATIFQISGSDLLTSIWFKEPAGYLQENWRELDKLIMEARVEGKVKGKYKVAFKGKLLSHLAQQIAGGPRAQVVHRTATMGSKGSSFIDGGFGRTGKSGYGGFRRIITTISENYQGGMKVQVIGTVIDIIVDVNDVYLKEEGSGDLSEFLGRAGVSIMKGGATAALASIFSAGMAAAVTLFIPGALPVFLGVLIVVGALIAAAYVVDYIDAKLGVKDSVAGYAR